ncbi:MAG: hypothetical protein OXF24_07895, partial [Hyphomicrobiales bacterium]|nr:hypothetical protein [Hyphomicrobiales bacterium]
EPASGSTRYSVDINARGTLPSTPFDVSIGVGGTALHGGDYTAEPSVDTSTADYTISTSSSNFTGGVLTLHFDILHDEVPEDTEMIELGLSGSLPEDWTFGEQSTHTVSIEANGGFIGFENTLTRAQESAGSVNLPVLISAPAPQDISYTVEIAGTDYAGNPLARLADDISHSPRVTFHSGLGDENSGKDGYQQTQPVWITLEGDDGPENEERFTVNLRLLRGGVPGGFETNLSHTFVIPAHGNTVVFEDMPPGFINEDGDPVVINLKLANPVPEDYTVDIAQAGGAAGDLTITPESLIIREGENEASFTLTANDDGNDRPVTIDLTLSSSQNLEGWEVPPATTHEILILDDEGALSAASFASGSSTTTEGATDAELRVPVTLSSAPLGPFSLKIDVVESEGENSADASDFSAPSTLMIPDSGETDFDLVIQILADPASEAELDETIVLKIPDEDNGLPPNFIIGTHQTHEITIQASDNTITFIPPNPDRISEDEGRSTITASITRPLPEGARATIEIVPTSENLENHDYYFSVPAGEGEIAGNTWILPTQRSSASLIVGANSNMEVEPDKTLTIGLSEGTMPEGWSASGASHDIIFLNDDMARIGFDAATSEEPEGENDRVVRIPIQVSADPAVAFPINVTVVDADLDERNGQALQDRAVERTDFTVPGTLNITGRGDAVEVTILSDLRPERDERFALEISAPDGGLPEGFTIEPSEAKHTVTINASDNTLEFFSGSAISFIEGSQSEGVIVIGVAGTNNVTPAGGLDLQIVITGTDTGENEVSFSPNPAHESFTHTFKFGEYIRLRGEQIPVYFHGDDGDDGNETITLTLTAQDPSTFPTEWGPLPNVTHTIEVIEPASVGGTIEFDRTESTVVQPENISAFHRVNIAVNGTPPVPGSAFDVTVTVNGTATPGDLEDYSITNQLQQLQQLGDSGTVSISSDSVGAGGHVPLDFMIHGDIAPEGTETIELTLSIDPPVEGWTLGTQTTHEISIPAHDNHFTFSSFPTEIAEGETLLVSLLFDNELEGEAMLRINASGAGITSDDFSISTPTGIDFNRGSDNSGGGVLTIPDGTEINTAGFTILFDQDNQRERDETLTLTIDGGHSDTVLPDGWEVGTVDNSRSITVKAHDNLIGFTDAQGANQKTSETQESGTHNVPVYVNLSHPTRSIILDVMRTGGSAENGRDYTVASQVEVPIGAGMVNIPVAIIPDDDYEVGTTGGETIELRISAAGTLPEGWDIDPDNRDHTITILNDDAFRPGGTVGFATGGTTVDENAGSVSLAVNSAAAPDAPLVFGWQLEDPDDDVGDDTGTVTIPAN